MPKVTVITITAEQRAALEKNAKHGKTYSFRRRCQAILLKTPKLTSLEVAQEIGCYEMSVNDWLKRYQERGIKGLQTQTGRGRKAILQTETDLAIVRQAVQNSRQRIALAKAELEQQLAKSSRN